MTVAEENLPAFGRELSSTVNPMWLLRTLPNNVLGHIGIRHGFKGANACITNHSIGGTLAVIEAMEALRTGEADRALAVGHDAPIEPQMVLYYHDVGLLAKDTIRPFDARRDGSLFGEGAAALVLETEASARQRNAAMLGEVLGGGSATEAQGLLAIRDDGDGLARAIETALDDAGLRAADVGMIVAHGNGTRQSDASEAAAIRRVFGAGAPPVTAFKWAFGHLIAAAGIIEAVLRPGEPAAAHRTRHRDLRAVADPDCAGVPRLAPSRSFAAQRRGARPVPRLRRNQRGAAGARRGLNARHRWRSPRRLPTRRTRCGIDTVEIARIERLLAARRPPTCSASLPRRNSRTAAHGPDAPRASPHASPPRRPASSCFRAKPRWAAIEPADFSVARDDYGAPARRVSPNAATALAKNRIRSIALSLTQTA